MRYICTIADSKILNDFEIFRQSIRNTGWEDPIFVFSHDKKLAKKLPSDCVFVYKEGWWADASKLDKCRNKPTLLKPSIFLSSEFREGDEILYMDSADLAIFCHPKHIFNANKKLLGAKPFSYGNYINRLDDKTREDLNLNPEYFKKHKIVNAGVIVGKISDDLLDNIKIWQDILLQYPKYGSPYPKAKVAGDQYAFNYIFRKMKDEGLADYLPKKYNLNSSKKVRQLEAREGVFYYGDKPVYVAHSTGGGGLPQWMKTLIKNGGLK